ncbi:hypothetical protein [Actinoalloteichus sp. GBA129-24]|uniref:hypothetical protein n=1 Tax=Actinoalloteichus sp. GBA129-24 TaxID=1612551 RepID=UPI000950639D|nr:hypothetical protein [Actinoalloteichus sp. GBA129-24]APU20923.1 hypothetical protein UA75_14565 [Actinoalloteichus sp. GBA129-24]APU24172.1 hypothetical protein UA75_31045 [Actinoalloteichus sp. GBA129-24]
MTSDPDTSPSPVRLPEPCWWVDYGDAWEDPHCLTRADAVRVINPGRGHGIVRQEALPCWQVTCHTCGEQQHAAALDGECGWECGGPLLDPGDVPPPRHPDQSALFEAMPTDDLGIPGGMVVMTEVCDG